MRSRAALCLLLVACAKRPLDFPCATHHAHTCPTQSTTLVENNVLQFAQAGSIALDGDLVYFPDFSSLIESVPRGGGQPLVVTQAGTNWVAALDHHLFYTAYCLDCLPSPNDEVTDQDLVSGATRVFHTSVVQQLFAASPTVIVAAGIDSAGTSVVRIDRSTGAIDDVGVPPSTPHRTALGRVLGGHAFFVGADSPMLRVESATGQFDFTSATPSAIATDGTSLLGADDSTFTFFDESSSTLSVVPHAPRAVDTVAFDADAIYSGAADDPQLYLTWRDGSGGCQVPLDGDGATDIEVDDEAIYVAVHGSWQLVRIDK